MSNGIDGKAKSGSPVLRLCVSEPEEIPRTDQGSSEESGDIRAATLRHPSQRAISLRPIKDVGELPPCSEKGSEPVLSLKRKGVR